MRSVWSPAGDPARAADGARQRRHVARRPARARSTPPPGSPTPRRRRSARTCSCSSACRSGWRSSASCSAALDRVHQRLHGARATTAPQPAAVDALDARRARLDAPRRRARHGDDRLGRRSPSVAFARLVLRLRRAPRCPRADVRSEGVRAAAQNPGRARDRPRHRSRRGQHRLRRRRAPARAAGRARRRRDRDGGRAGRRRAPGAHPRARRRADGRVPARRGRGRGPLLRRERPLGVRGRPGARGRDARRRPARRAAAPPTRRSRSRPRSAAPAARPRTRCSGWSRRCWRCRSCPKPDHAADALAVAICHANGAPMARRAARPRR